jgi:pyruvate dehydrogenase E1 component
MNENYEMPPMPENAKEGILKGMYRFKASDKKNAKMKAHLFGSGTILNEVLKAKEILEDDYKVSADVWSITSYKELRRNALEVERWNLLHPGEKQKTPYITKLLQNEKGVFIAASDYVKTLPDSISKWVPGNLISLGTDGFGRSDTRAALRDFFEVDAKHIVLAALTAIAREDKTKMNMVEKAIKDLEINSSKKNPHTS